MTSYLTSLTLFLYLVPFLRYLTSNVSGFDLDLWPLKVIWGQFFISFENPYMTSYLTSIDIFSLSRTVFEIFDFKLFRVWPWPSTSKGHLRLKVFIPFESPYMISYLTSIDTLFLSRTVLRYLTSNFSEFDLDLWPLKVIWDQKYLYNSKARVWLSIWLL